MPGLFNVQNALAAIAVCEGLGIPEQCIYVGLMKARVPGRMEVYQNADGRITAIVDYAHNRLSFEKLFQSVKAEYPGQRVTIVFGCPGKKALDRRKDLSEIAAKYADKVILTEEDAGEEDVLDICREMAAHIAPTGRDYSIEPDRGGGHPHGGDGRGGPHGAPDHRQGGGDPAEAGHRLHRLPLRRTRYLRVLHEYDVSHRLDGMEKVLGLLDTLPRLAQSAGKTMVLKYGGSAWGENGAVDSILRDVAALQMAGVRVVLVHGGGKSISGWLRRMGEEPVFRDGYRVTDGTAMAVSEMVLSGEVNKQIVMALRGLGGEGRRRLRQGRGHPHRPAEGPGAGPGGGDRLRRRRAHRAAPLRGLCARDLPHRRRGGRRELQLQRRRTPPAPWPWPWGRTGWSTSPMWTASASTGTTPRPPCPP